MYLSREAFVIHNYIKHQYQYQILSKTFPEKERQLQRGEQTH